MAERLQYPDELSATLLELRMRFDTLAVYRGVLDDPAVQSVRELVDLLAEGGLLEPQEFASAIGLFHEAVSVLLEDDAATAHQAGDLWQRHLLDVVLQDVNAFTEAAEQQAARLAPPLLARVRAELGVLQRLHRLSLNDLQDALRTMAPKDAPPLEVVWTNWNSFWLVESAPAKDDALAELKHRLAASDDWGGLAEELAAFHAVAGSGLFSRYRAFRWIPYRNAGGELEPIPAPDPIRLSDLVSYEREQELVLRNTRYFVQGAPGNNVLLYGDAGTGKSSLVKALLNEYGGAGLRLIEVAKEDLSDFPYIVREVRGRRQRFILFVDDLSFEEDETEYKALKALLEGGIEARPENLLIYATSNRRHLVREGFGDRTAPGEEDVHPMETMQEKLSLSERFGIRVAFLAPDQERFFTITESLARQAGIKLPADELRRRALVWAQWQNGFSGRTARQFVDDLLGELQEKPQ